MRDIQMLAHSVIMSLSKGFKVWSGIGVMSFLLPYPYYWYSRASGKLLSEDEWWNQGINHGPWRWEWPMATILPFMYLLFFGAGVLLLVGMWQSVRTKLFTPVLSYTVLASIYLGLFYVQASTLFWTID